MPTELSLTPDQARLVSLAVAYHLGRPGAEIDRATMAQSTHGLRMCSAILEAQRELPLVKLTLDAHQLRLLLEAMLQCINELKVLAMLDPPWAPGQGSGHSVNIAFEQAAAELYPGLRREPAASEAISASMFTLHRRLTGALRDDANLAYEQGVRLGGRPRTARRPWWRFWHRE